MVKRGPAHPVDRANVLLAASIIVCGTMVVGELLWLMVVPWMKRPRAGVQVPRRLRGPGSDGYPGVDIGYLVYLPKDYGSGDRRWPLVLFLHGAGERGSDVEEVERCGPPALVCEGQVFPFVLVSPQCPPHQRWEPLALLRLVDHVVERYQIDPERVYVTGYSMGGAGTWDLAVAASERFAAIAPLAGGGNVCGATRLAGLSIWAFHGARDEIVSLEANRSMVEAVRAAGGRARLTVYENEGHAIDEMTYGKPEFWNWLLAQRRQSGANVGSN